MVERDGNLNNNSFDAILVFESFQADRIQLLTVIESSSKLFGDPTKFMDSSIVIGTKHNLCGSRKDIEPRIEEIQKIANSYRAPLLLWESDFNLHKVPENINYAQKKKFVESLAKVKPYSDKIIKELKEKIEARASELHHLFLVEKQEISVQVPTQVLEKYNEEVQKKREKIIPIITHEKVNVTKQRQETQYEIKHEEKTREIEIPVEVGRTVSRGLFNQLFGITKVVYSTEMRKVNITENVPTIQSKEVTKEYTDTENRPKVNYKTEYESYSESETRYRAHNQMKNVNTIVEKSKPNLEYFRNIAKKEVMEEFKQLIKKKL